MDLDEDLLEGVARGVPMDYSRWPSLLQPLIERLNYIIAEEFPPVVYNPEPEPQHQDLPDDITPLASQNKPSEPPSSQDSSTTTEPASQPALPPRPLPPVPPFSSPPPPPPPAPQPRNLSSPSPDPPPLPNPLTTLLTSITTTLTTSFPIEPPHTIQRLSELVLRPTTHYRTLPAYLRALDRVVSVSSPASIFPLPIASPPGGVLDPGIQSNGPLMNGTNTSTASIEWSETLLGSDESLGGALLTPIPWLRHATANADPEAVRTSSPRPIEESPDDTSSNDTPILTPTSSTDNPAQDPASTSPSSAPVQVPPRENGAVTQGELIRQEQEAGVIPVNQTLHHHRNTYNTLQRAIGAVQSRDFAQEGEEQDDEMKVEGDGDGDADEIPHARGPDLLGVEDMGLQDGKDVELSLAGHAFATVVKPATKTEKETEVNSQAHETQDNEWKEADAQPENADRDGDIVLADANIGAAMQGMAKDGKAAETEAEGAKGEGEKPVTDVADEIGNV